MTCACGHTAHWHGHSGTGSCEHDGECRCERFTALPDQSGADLIAAERQRQMDVEGWTPEHDDWYTRGELAKAAALYANEAHFGRTHSHMDIPPRDWPWASEWWKPTGDAVRDLVKAGALIAAEIDRLNRLTLDENRHS